MINRRTSIVWRYALVILIANLSTAVLSLLFKLSLLTVQGPTTLSRTSGIVIYYMVLSAASYLMFKRFRKKQDQIRRTEVAIFLGFVFLIHTLVVCMAQWPVVWFFSTGSLPLAQFIYNGGEYIESIRDIPRSYYFVALALEDLCVFTFARIACKTGDKA